jgi:multiple sugar transport system permease protein
MVVALFAAVLLNTKLKGMKIFETVFFLPYITNIIAIGLAFKFIMHSQYGVLNMFAARPGARPHRWLNDPHYALPALMIFGIWSGLSFKIVVFLAGIQGITGSIIRPRR